MAVLAGAYWVFDFDKARVAIAEMARQKISTKEYKELAKKLRSDFRGFEARDGFDLRQPNTWTPAQKAKVTRKVKVINILQTRDNVKLYSPRIESRKRKLQAESQYEHYEKDAKFIYFPVKPDADVKITYSKAKKKKHRPIIHVDKVRVEPIFFNKKAFLKDPDKELRRVLDTEPDAVQYEFMAGDYLSDRTYVREGIIKKLAALRAQYENYKDWMLGIRAYIGSESPVDKLVFGIHRARTERQTKEKRKERRTRKLGQRRLGRIR